MSPNTPEPSCCGFLIGTHQVTSCARGLHAALSTLGFLILIQGACLYAAPVVAQTAPAAEGLQEVVVTARKREESIVKTPESLTVFSAQAIQDLHIENLVDYATKTPNLSFAYGVTTTGIFSRSIAIRGISGVNTTAIYLDDTPIGQSFDPRILDLDRIEILKGPQGSLFGADSMGGAVRLISNKPNTSETSYRLMTEAGVTSGGGSADYGIEGGANFVVVPDVIAVRAVLFDDHDAGFLTRVNPVPGDPSKLESINDQGATTNYGFALTGLAHIIPDLDLTLRLFNQITNLPHGWPATLAPLPAFEPVSYIRPQPTDLQDLAYTEVWLPSLSLTYQQKQWSLSSSTSFFNLSDHQVEASQLGTIQAFQEFYGVLPPPNIPPWNRQDQQWQFTQEFRLTFEDVYRMSGVVGLYYNNQHRDVLFPPVFYPGLTDLGIGADTDDFYYEHDQYHDTELAAFGELNYHLTNRLTLSVGGREYHLTDTSHTVAGGFLNGGAIVIAPPEEVDTGFTPKFTLASTVGDNGNAYVSWAKGFRPGGGNGALPSQCDAALDAIGLTPDSAQTYHPDSVRTTEIGAKGEFNDHRFFASAAAFQTDWINVQQVVNLPSCGYQVRANTGAGRIRGGEMEIDAKVVDGFDVSLGAGYEDARVTDAGNGAFVVGERLFEIPEVTATARGTYRFPITARMGGMVSADVSYTGNSLSANTTPDTPLTRPAYTLENARIGVEWARSSLTLYLNNIGNVHANLADLRFIGFNETTVNSAGQTVALPRVVVLAPVQAGLQFRVNF